MASNVPTIRQVAWVSLVPQLTLMGLLIYAYHIAEFEKPATNGILTYLAVSLILRYSIPNNHRKGANLVKRERFKEAIPYFETSYRFFTKHSWLDKYRFITLLSSSKMCYKEMALNNIAFCYGQSGDGQKCAEYYRRTLAEYPNNGLAKAALNLLQAGQTTQRPHTASMP